MKLLWISLLDVTESRLTISDKHVLIALLIHFIITNRCYFTNTQETVEGE